MTKPTMVQWSSGYDFCLTLHTEGLQFDPGLNHLFVSVHCNELSERPVANETLGHEHNAGASVDET
jgi:hypothetical protein